MKKFIKKILKEDLEPSRVSEDIRIIPIDLEGDFYDDDFEDVDMGQAYDIAYKIAKDSGINILRGKDLRYVALGGDGSVVGGLWTEIDDNLFSFDVAVDKMVQGKGIGEKLVRMAISEFDGQNVEGDLAYKIDVTNPIMEKLLLKYGFKVIDKIPGHTIMGHADNNPKLNENMKKIIKKLLSEGLVGVEGENLLKWFSERSNHTFVFFDTETTGLSRGGGNHITQIGALAAYFNPETLRFVEMSTFNKHIKLSSEIQSSLDSEKDLEIPDDRNDLVKMLGYSKRAILKYNHYDIEKSASYDDELSVLLEFQNFLDDQGDVILLAHNAPFDLKFVEVSEMFRDADVEVFDTLAFFRKVFYPILTRISSSRERDKELLDKFGEKKSSALVNLIKGFSSPSELESKLSMAHDAAQDCRNTLEVFDKAIHIVYQHLSGK